MSGKKEKLYKLYNEMLEKGSQGNYTRKSISTLGMRSHNIQPIRLDPSALSPRPAALRPQRQLDFSSPNLETRGLVKQYPVVILPRANHKRSSVQASTFGAKVEEPVRETKRRSSQMGARRQSVSGTTKAVSKQVNEAAVFKVPAAKFLQTKKHGQVARKYSASKIPWPPRHSFVGSSHISKTPKSVASIRERPDDEEESDISQSMSGIEEESDIAQSMSGIEEESDVAQSMSFIKEESDVAQSIPSIKEEPDMEQPTPSIKEDLQHWTVTSVSNKRKPSSEITPVHSRKIIKRVSSVANNIGQSNSEIKQEHTNVTKQSNSQIMIRHSNYNLLENSENPMLPSDSTSTVSDNNESEIMHQASNNDNMPSFQQVMPETVNVPLQSCVKSDPVDGPSNNVIVAMLEEINERQKSMHDILIDMQQRQVKLEEQIFELQNINQIKKRRSSGKENSEPLSDILQSESNAQDTEESSVGDDRTLMPPPRTPGISKSKHVKFSNDSERPSEGGAKSGSDASRKSVTPRRSVRHIDFKSPKTASALPSVSKARVDTPAKIQTLIQEIRTRRKSFAFQKK